MRIYLAGRYGRRLELRAYAERLRALGHEITSRWLDGEHEAFDATPTREQMIEWSYDDISDICDADVLIAFTEPPTSEYSRGGRHVEFGYALAKGMFLARVGPVENIFYSWCNAGFGTADDFFAAVESGDIWKLF